MVAYPFETKQYQVEQAIQGKEETSPRTSDLLHCIPRLIRSNLPDLYHHQTGRRCAVRDLDQLSATRRDAQGTAGTLDRVALLEKLAGN